MLRPLTLDLSLGDRRPYFQWDEHLSIRELRVAREFPSIRHRLGRRLPFWEFLLGGWERLGILAR